MSDFFKTGIFVATALVAVVIAAIAMTTGRSSSEVVDALDPLFPEFESAMDATSMEILAFDAQKGSLHPFKVAKIDGLWVIPSHAYYPADAAEHFADAATSLIGLKRGAKVSDDPKDHATYGVVEPVEGLSPGKEGVGTLVTFKGEDDQTLAELIIGKQVGEGAQPDLMNPHANVTSNQSDLRYVRIRNVDRVYRAKIDSSKFSTKFEDWIEQDLLKLKSSWKIQRVVINDYDLIDPGLGLEIVRQDLMDFAYDSQSGDWSLANAPTGTDLDTEKLDDLRNALQDLKIVDVFTQNRVSMINAGFYNLPNGFFSRDGEIIVELEGGIVYRLLFGKIAPKTLGQQTEEEKDKEDEDVAKKDEKTKDNGGEDVAEAADGEDVAEAVGDNRYLFVYVHSDKNLIGEPDIKPLPHVSLLGSISNDGEAKKEKQADSTKAKDGKADPQPGSAEDEPSPGDVVRELMQLDEEKLLTEAEYDRKLKEVQDHNRQQMEEIESQIEAAEKAAKELRDRFVPWFYVIDNAMYKKFHLTRKDVIKTKEESKEESDKKEDKE